VVQDNQWGGGFLDGLSHVAQELGPIGNSGSPALLMKAARFRLGASENPQGNQGRQLCYRPGIIESAGEPEISASFDRESSATQIDRAMRGETSAYVNRPGTP
jgi:hypothetical protein